MINEPDDSENRNSRSEFIPGMLSLPDVLRGLIDDFVLSFAILSVCDFSVLEFLLCSMECISSIFSLFRSCRLRITL